MNEPRPQRLSRTIAALIILDIVVLIAAAVIAANMHASGPVTAVTMIAIGLPLAYLTLAGPLRRMSRNFMALNDGVRGFADGDFSLRLRVTGHDEITDLVGRYNEIGDVLRSQRQDGLQRELMFETILQATPLAIVLTAPSGRVHFANRPARDLFSPAQRLEGRSFETILRGVPALHDAYTSERDSLFSSGSETYHLSHRMFHINDQPHTLWIANRLTAELRRQEVEVWKRAIRVLNHELNNTLAPIRSLFHSARAIRHHPEQWHRMDEINAAVEERLDYLQRFLDGYAQFARLPQPHPLPTRWIDLLSAVQQIVEFQLAAPLPAHSSPIDRAQVEQVVINLVKNAIEAGSSPRDVEVAVERRAGGSVLMVSDRGSEMSNETMAQALLPFWSTKSGGSGLGLPLCNEIVDGHGGHLRIVRRAGGGTTVSCWFPDSA